MAIVFTSVLALALCQRDGRRNRLAMITCRQADGSTWSDPARYDCIPGAAILYGASLHGALRQIFRQNLAPGGSVLLDDPFRAGCCCGSACSATAFTTSRSTCLARR